MTAIYDDVKKLYEALKQGDMKTAKDLVSHLKGHGLDKRFIQDMLETIAFAKIVEEWYNEVEKKPKKEDTPQLPIETQNLLDDVEGS